VRNDSVKHDSVKHDSVKLLTSYRQDGKRDKILTVERR
jgi:hypothetical protein